MARPATIHVCSDCGHTEPRWHGQCAGCGAWNTLVEEAAPPKATAGGRAGRARGAAGANAALARTPTALRDVRAEQTKRLQTSIGELDRVLGGGLVPGSLVLLGGSRESASPH